MEAVSIDISKVRTIKELHELLMDNLKFPAFYGMNWDAFWDSITGLVEMPDKLEFTGWINILDRFPKDAEILRKCLNDYNSQPDLKKIELIIK